MAETMRRAWAVRPKPHGTKRMDEFLDQGIVALGWPTLGDLSGEDRSGIKKRLREHHTGKSNRTIGNWGGQLHRLVNKVQPGDLVIAPDGDTLFIGEVTSRYRHDEEVTGGDFGAPDAGYPHQRKVEWLHEKQGVSRSLATGKLYDALKSRLTLFELPLEDVEELASRAPTTAGGTYDDLQERYLEKLQGGKLAGMNANSFEDAVRIVLRRHFPGLSRQATFSDAEGDTDLLTELPGDVTVRVQVKHYDPSKGAIGESPVEQLADSMQPGDNGLVVTSGTIGERAEEAASRFWEEEQKAVSFIDGETFVDLVFDNLGEYDDEELAVLALRRNVQLP